MQLGYIGPDGSKWHGSYGYRNVNTGKQVNDSTLFMIASCAKPVTALAVMKLHDRGTIHLDDNINDYLPFEVENPSFPGVPISFRMLLTHVSSIKDNWEVLDPLYTVEEGGDSPLELSSLGRGYFTEGGDFYSEAKNFYGERPGQNWAYSNMGYALLGYLVERVTGSDFSTYTREEIFAPLGMRNSYWFLREIPHENIARPHVLPESDPREQRPEVLKHYGYPDYPDGQLRTTVEDYLKFQRLILNEGSLEGKRFISSEVIRQFHTIQFPSVAPHQAVAWNYNEFDNRLYYLLMRRLPSHTGGDPGVAAVTSFDPKRGTAAVIFVNSPPNTFWGGKIFYLDMLKMLLRVAER